MEHAPTSLPGPRKGGHVEPETASPVHGDMCPRNIVLFGETGVGKSSLINLIAGQHLAQTSNDALGCTAQHQRYDVTLTLPCDASGSGSCSETKFRSVTVSLWDTAGLDEGTQGTVPATVSTVHLRSLLRTLAQSPTGVHLLLFCIRGTGRLTRALQRHYDLVYSSVCRKNVRIVLVVTGLEHKYLERSAGMESWWEENEEATRQLGMVFDGHVCVTTVDVQEGVGRERRLASQKQLRELLVWLTRPGTTSWRIEPSWWRSMAVPVLRNLLRRIHGASRVGRRRHVDVCNSRVYQIFEALKQLWSATDRKRLSGQRGHGGIIADTDTTA